MNRWLVLLLVCLAVFSMPSFGGDPLSTSEQSLRIIADASALQWPGGPSDSIWGKIMASGQEGGLEMSRSEMNISLNMDYLGYGDGAVRSYSHDDDTESYIDMNLNNIYKDYGPAISSGFDLMVRPLRPSPVSIEGAMARSDQDMGLSFDVMKSTSLVDAEHGEYGYAASEENLARLYGASEAIGRLDPWILNGAMVSVKDYSVSDIGQSGQKGADCGQIRKGRKNYALVIGINVYSDRRGLHTCINDANSVASILSAYGYEVILLTDDTLDKPTKHNILDGALSEICTKQDLGNVIIYFSGHAFKDNSGDFYLVPQDGSGVPSSYIGGEDFDKYIKNLDNLALIIDACNSGGFDGEIFQGQVALLSSGADQPSNEEWPGHLSVFTSQLCEAIKEEHKKNNEVVLQKCFYIARNNTIQWSEGRLLRQTPQIRDRTSGTFYLN